MLTYAASFDEQLSPVAPFLFYVVIAGIIFIETGLLLGWLPEDCIGRNPSEFIHGDDLPVYAVKLKAISDCKPITPPGWGAMKCWYYSMGYRI